MKIFQTTLFFILTINLLFAQDQVPHRAVYYIQSALKYGKDNGACWDIRGKHISYKKGQNLCVWELSDQLPDRKYRIIYSKEEGGNHWYTISPLHAKGWARVDVQGDGSNNGTNIQIWDKKDTDNQLFRFKHLGNGRFKIYCKNGKVLCLNQQKSANGTNIHLWDDHDGSSVEWYLIDATTNTAYVPKNKTVLEVDAYKNPFVKVVDAQTGAPIANASVTLYDGILRANKPYTKNTNQQGEASFEDIPTQDNQYYLVVSAPAYGSKRLNGNNLHSKKVKTFKLDKIGGRLPVEVFNNGIWLYEKVGDQYYYVDGTAKKDADFYFHKHNELTDDVSRLKKAIGLDGTPATTDEEVFRQFKQVWDFWHKHRVDVLMTPRTQELKNAKELLLSDKGGRWPGIHEYAHIFNTYNCLPTLNCSSIAFEFANLLTLTGIPHHRMFVEQMLSNSISYGQHVAVCLFIKNKWAWIDPGINTPVSTLDNFNCIPTRLDNQYNTPYSIILFPDSKDLRVPKCELLSE